MSASRKICFVIMPFSKTTDEHTEGYWTEHFNSFLKPLIEANPNLEARRSEALRGDILKQIITSLVISPVVVADLTDHNSNVYWELGVRQSFMHCTVTIAEDGTKLPFDIGAKGTLYYYPKNHLKNADFCKKFNGAINDCLLHPEIPDSHVLETISGRGTLFEIFRRDEAIRRLDAVLSEYNRNSAVWSQVVEQAKLNQKNPAKRELVSSRCRMSATELLVTNRYVDEDRSFFELAERCLSSIIAINDQLSLWENRVDSTEKWFIISEELYAKQFLDFTAKVVAVREKLVRLI